MESGFPIVVGNDRQRGEMEFFLAISVELVPDPAGERESGKEETKQEMKMI